MAYSHFIGSLKIGTYASKTPRVAFHVDSPLGINPVLVKDDTGPLNDVLFIPATSKMPC